MTRLLREPLLHFFLLGVLLFGLYGWLNRGALNAPNEIVVSRGQLQSLQAQFERVWQRPPTAAGAAGPDRQLGARGDFLSRRSGDGSRSRRSGRAAPDRSEAGVHRRRQRLPPRRPTPELQAWLDAHPENYRIEPSYSLRQVYFDPARHGDATRRRDCAARRALEHGQSAPATQRCCRRHRMRTATEVATHLRQRVRAMHSRRCRSAAGRGRCVRASVCTWSSDRAPRADARRRSTKFATTVERDLLHARTQAGERGVLRQAARELHRAHRGRQRACAEPAG